MQTATVLDSYFNVRYLVFQRRHALSLANKIMLSLGMACVTGLLAQVRIILPWTPVPITGQTFAVLLSGVLLGRLWGGVSQILYIIIGVAGVSWFSSGTGGYIALVGPTGGYLMGFILASLFIGYFTDRYIRARGFFPMIGLMTIANFILIYVPGMLHLAFWYYCVKGTVPSLQQLFLIGAMPFFFGDTVKIMLAAVVTKVITPKKSYC